MSPKPVLAINKMLADTSILERLECYTRSKLSDLEFDNQTAAVINSKIQRTTINVNAQGKASIPDGIPHVTGKATYKPAYLTDEALVLTVSLAFEAILCDIEKILNKDLKNAVHQVEISILLHKTAEKPKNGHWHYDGVNPFPVTSIIYFLHECQAFLSLRKRTRTGLFSEDNSPGFALMETKKGSVISFLNTDLEHRVEKLQIDKNKEAPNGIQYRGLFLVHWEGLANMPPQMRKFQTGNDFDAEEKKDKDGTVTYVACLPKAKL